MHDNTAGVLGRANGRVTLWLARIAATLLAFLAALTFCDVVGRAFGYPFSFSVEITEFAMGLIVYLSVGLTTHVNGHVAVDFVTLRLNHRLRALFDVVTNILALAFLAVMVWRIWGRAWELHDLGDTTQILIWPLWPVAFVMAIGSIFFLTGFFLYLLDAIARVGGRRGAHD